MTPVEFLSFDLAEVAQALRDKQEPFAFATIVRTAGSTAAKPGAKALLSADGTILHGWLGGGCTRGAVKSAVVRCLQDGITQLVSVTPEEALAEKGVMAGDEVDGTRYARNGCPSKGTVDIFVEPCIPIPQLVVVGDSPVAQALSDLAPHFHWTVGRSVPASSEETLYRTRFVVVATQGQSDLDALKAALSCGASYVAFVGSERKYAILSEKLEAAGIDRVAIGNVSAPAGLRLGAVTPEEIALSILAELVQVKRSAVVQAHA
jgi:xanthine dehydrogenase accessory factor